MKDYYQILEIAHDSSQDAIKEQYRFLVQAWHPDKFPNSAQKLKAEEKLKEINEAYETLRNPAKRAEYDSDIRYANSSYKQEYHEQKSQRQTEGAHRRKEEAARHAQEEKWQRERVNRERAEAEKRRTEEVKRQRISQLDQEISVINQEINKLSKELPKMPNPIFAILFLIGGFYIPAFGASENSGLFLFLGGLSVVTGIILFRQRNKFYRETYKPRLDEVEQRKQHFQKLVRERLYLKNGY